MTEWKMDPPRPGDKDIRVSGRGLEVWVDYDDVNHEVVLQETERMVHLLNEAEERGWSS